MLNVLLSFLLGIILINEEPLNGASLDANDTTFNMNWLHQKKLVSPDEEIIISLEPYVAENTYLKIVVGTPFYLFNNSRLVAAVKEEEINISLDSLRTKLTSDTLIVYTQSSVGQVAYGFYTKIAISSFPAFTKELSLERNHLKEGRKNFLIGLIIAFFLLLSALKVNFPKKFQDVFSLSGTFSTRALEGDAAKLRLFEQDGLFSAFIYTFAMAMLIYLHLSFESASSGEIKSVDYMSFFQSWLFIILLMIVKISVIFFLSGLYKTNKINTFYIRELIHISVFFITILLTITILLYFYNGDLPPYWNSFVKYTVLIMYLIRMVLIYFKILKLSGFTYLYLFSYFCATEIFPFVLGLKYFY